jgi:hypothetical protein
MGHVMGHVMGQVMGQLMGQGPSYGQTITQGFWPKTGAGGKEKALNQSPRRHKPQNTRFAARRDHAAAPAASFHRLTQHIAPNTVMQEERGSGLSPILPRSHGETREQGVLLFLSRSWVAVG